VLAAVTLAAVLVFGSAKRLLSATQWHGRSMAQGHRDRAGACLASCLFLLIFNIFRA